MTRPSAFWEGKLFARSVLQIVVAVACWLGGVVYKDHFDQVRQDVEIQQLKEKLSQVAQDTDSLKQQHIIMLENQDRQERKLNDLVDIHRGSRR